METLQDIQQNTTGQLRISWPHSPTFPARTSSLAGDELGSRSDRRGRVKKVRRIYNELAEADGVSSVAVDLAAARADLIERRKRRETKGITEGDCGLQTRMGLSLVAEMNFTAG